MKKILLSQTANLDTGLSPKLYHFQIEKQKLPQGDQLLCKPCSPVGILHFSHGYILVKILCCQEVQAVLHLSTFVHLVAFIAIIIMTDADKRFETLRFLMWLLERPRVDLDTEESLMIIDLKSSW